MEQLSQSYMMTRAFKLRCFQMGPLRILLNPGLKRLDTRVVRLLRAETVGLAIVVVGPFLGFHALLSEPADLPSAL